MNRFSFVLVVCWLAFAAAHNKNEESSSLTSSSVQQEEKEEEASWVNFFTTTRSSLPSLFSVDTQASFEEKETVPAVVIGRQEDSIAARRQALQLSIFDNDDHEQCYVNLLEVDTSGDSKVSQQEYLDFIYVQSNGIIDNVTYPSFDTLDLKLRAIYHFSEWETNGQIDLTTDDLDKLRGTVIYICDAVTLRVTELTPTASPSVSALPSLSPSLAPSPPSVSPSRNPSTSPSAVPTRPPTDETQARSSITQDEPSEEDDDGNDFPQGLLLAILAIACALCLILALTVRRKQQLMKEAAEEQRRGDTGHFPVYKAHRDGGLEDPKTEDLEASRYEASVFATAASMIQEETKTEPPTPEKRAGRSALAVEEVEDWVESKDAFGKTTYYNKQSGEVTWERPRILAESIVRGNFD